MNQKVLIFFLLLIVIIVVIIIFRKKLEPYSNCSSTHSIAPTAYAGSGILQLVYSGYIIGQSVNNDNPQLQIIHILNPTNNTPQNLPVIQSGPQRYLLIVTFSMIVSNDYGVFELSIFGKDKNTPSLSTNNVSVNKPLNLNQKYPTDWQQISFPIFVTARSSSLNPIAYTTIIPFDSRFIPNGGIIDLVVKTDFENSGAPTGGSAGNMIYNSNCFTYIQILQQI